MQLSLAWHILFTAFVICEVVHAQTPDPIPPGQPPDTARPALTPFPEREDWSLLQDPSKRTER